MKKEQLYTAAIDKWGWSAQIDMLIEECAELIVSINKYRRDGNPSILEEIADVEIMIEQARIILGAVNSSHIDEWKVRKLKRLEERLYPKTNDN